MKSTSLRLILFAATLFCVPCSYAAPFEALRGTLRIRLLEQFNPRVAQVSCSAQPIDVFVGESQRPAFRAPSGSRLDIALNGRDVTVSGPDGRVHAGQVRLVPSADADLTVQLPGQSESRSYRGSLVISRDDEANELKLVNFVPLEDYVASVVASEYGLPDVEGSRAMAVIIRTYALKAIHNSDDSYDHVDHTLSQVYRGTRTVNPAASRAAASTRGEVLTFNGQLIEAVYSSSSGGHTANNEDVWQAGPHPYLRGRPDPYDTISPNHSWEFSISADRLHRFVQDTYGLNVKQVEVAQRTSEGRARMMGLAARSGRSREMSADEFRREFTRAFGVKALRSTMFTLTHRGGMYTFEGHGFGHGVGLSQWGAHAMALAGKSYRDILKFYYSGVRLESRDIDSDESVPVPAARTTQIRPVAPRAGGWSAAASASSLPRAATVSPPSATSPPRPVAIEPQVSPKPAAARPRTKRRVGW